MVKDPDQSEDENLQQMMVELRTHQQNLEKLQSQKEVLTTSIEEIKEAKESVDELGDLEEDTEILVPIGAGSFITAEIKKTDKILCSLGADFTAEKGLNGTKKLLEKRKKGFKDSLEQIEERIEEVEDRVQELRPKAQKLMAQQQQRNQVEE